MVDVGGVFRISCDRPRGAFLALVHNRIRVDQSWHHLPLLLHGFFFFFVSQCTPIFFFSWGRNNKTADSTRLRICRQNACLSFGQQEQTLPVCLSALTRTYGSRIQKIKRERERGLLHAVNNPCLVTKGTWQKSDSLWQQRSLTSSADESLNPCNVYRVLCLWRCVPWKDL